MTTQNHKNVNTVKNDAWAQATRQLAQIIATSHLPENMDPVFMARMKAAQAQKESA